MLCSITLFYHLILLNIFDSNCLRNVNLRILPQTVQKGHTAKLRCSYDLENAPLYSVKFYRGTYEFYRYSPREIPATKIFPFSGIQIDLSNSNSSLVTLRNVGFHLSGNFSCEVTTDAPLFSTAFVSEHMSVVTLPDRQPIIRVEKSYYKPGDVLHANCSTAPSKPPTNLVFFLNNVLIRDTEIRDEQLSNMLTKSDLFISVKLRPEHYWNGYLVLKCLAIVENVYQQSTELQVDFHDKDNALIEKVMYFSNESESPLRQSKFANLLLILCSMFFS